MKKVIFFSIAAFVFTVFTSFKAAPPAVVTDTHTDICGPFGVLNSCNGEIITITGCYGADFHTVINGNKAHFSVHVQGHLDGTGSLGNDYNVQINENLNETVTLGGGQAEENLVINEQFNSKGSAPNLRIRETLHITINSNGVVTVNRVDVEVLCNG